MPPPKEEKSLKFPAKKPTQKPAVASDGASAATQPESAPVAPEFKPSASGGLPDLEIRPAQATGRRDALNDEGEQAQVQTLPVGTKIPQGLLDQPLPPPAKPSLSSTGSMKKLVPKLPDPEPGTDSPTLIGASVKDLMGQEDLKTAPARPAHVEPARASSRTSQRVPVPRPQHQHQPQPQPEPEAESLGETDDQTSPGNRRRPADPAAGDPARRKAQLIVGTVIGMVVVGVLIASMAKGDRPSTFELKETYALSFEKRKPDPDVATVDFELADELPCPGHTVQTCYIYKLTAPPKYQAKMIVYRGPDGWLLESLTVRH